MPKISGIIDNIQNVDRNTKKITIIKGEKTRQVTYNKFIWIFKGDKITVSYDADSKECRKHPIVCIDDSVFKISQEFKKIFNIGNTLVLKLIAHIADKFQIEKDDINTIISQLSDEYDEVRYISKRLLSFKEIKKKLWREFFEYWQKNYNKRRLYNLNINNREISDSMTSTSDIYSSLMDNPLQIIGLSKEKSKNICDILEIEIDDIDSMCNSFMLEMFNKLKSARWTCISNYKMLPHIKKLESFNIIYDEVYKYFYLRPIINIENKLVKIFSEIESYPKINIKYESNELEGNQLKAIQLSLTNNLFIIGGSAGTGKTTIIKHLIGILDENNYQYIMASFTGKAVCVLRQKTGKQAFTFHSLFMDLRVDREKYKKNKNLHLIIDEFSMIDTHLLWRLLSIFKNELGKYPTITFVGDINQLMPIKWGNPFYEMITSGCISKIFLNKNYRIKNKNGELNGIIINSEAIVKNIKLINDFYESKNFTLINGNMKILFKLIDKMKDRDINISQFIVLCPYTRDVDDINKYMQLLFNKHTTRQRDSAGNLWILGDKVIVTKNNNYHNIYNGQEGIIIDVTKKEITVKLLGSDKLYHFIMSSKIKKLDENGEENDDPETKSKELYSHNLSLSYAITVHKSQGSEWDIVYIFISHDSEKIPAFLNKSLLYTAMTRPTKMLVIVFSNKRVLISMRYKNRPSTKECLSKRIKSVLTKKEEIHQEENIDFEEATKSSGILYQELEDQDDQDFEYDDQDFEYDD